jgi:hypothetical protein
MHEVSIWVGCAQKATHAPWPFSDLFMRPHLLYSASSPVPFTNCSVLYNGISSLSLGSKRRNLNPAKTIVIFCRFVAVHISPARTGELKESPPAEPHASGRHTYDGVLRGVPKGSLGTLLPPPQCHAALGTMPHTFVSVGQSPFCRPRTLRLSSTRTPRVWFCRGCTKFIK